jgi:Ca-activated chloride channel family protein
MYRTTDRARQWRVLALPFAAAFLAAACGAGAPATPTAGTAAPPTAAPGTAGPTDAAPTAAGTSPLVGPPNIEAPTTVGAGNVFEVTWTGPIGPRDFVTIVKATATKWTNEPYFYATYPSPQELTAPSEPGAYELWYVEGEGDTILFRRDIEVTAFVGSVDGPDQVPGGSEFDVTWTGPDGPGDYVTIVKAGAERWTNEDYFYTASAPKPSKLLAPVEGGAYELWYVLGADDTIAARAPITVLPPSASVQAPEGVDRGNQFDVAWTGPNGPGDFITIVAAGAGEAAYLDYCYTHDGPTCTLTAPDQGGQYEVRYTTGTNKVLASKPIVVR